MRYFILNQIFNCRFLIIWVILLRSWRLRTECSWLGFPKDNYWYVSLSYRAYFIQSDCGLYQLFLNCSLLQRNSYSLTSRTHLRWMWQSFIRSCERLELLSESEAQVLTREGQTTPETRRAEKVRLLAIFIDMLQRR